LQFFRKKSILSKKMIDELDTGRNSPGDLFRSSLTQPIVVNGKTLVAKDDLVQGRIIEVVSSGRLKQPASITLKLTQLKLSNSLSSTK
jgi:hypothetical protein